MRCDCNQRYLDIKFKSFNCLFRMYFTNFNLLNCPIDYSLSVTHSYMQLILCAIATNFYVLIMYFVMDAVIHIRRLIFFNLK